MTGVVVCESGVEPGGVCSTESRKEKVWETGLKLSPVIKAKLALTSPPLLAAAELMFASALMGGAFPSCCFCPFLVETGKSSTHMGS